MEDLKLPDPTEDLHWSDFRKPIHDVFSENARNHPDWPCVTETTPWRRFSYRSIDQASNVLAHHFVQKGIQRGDVIMIYAHRGVDLVVAIMGVLKSGATFSVIDPAYPPDRQTVYLDVARPKALVVIQKATESAGGLAPKVVSWIAENLNLKTTIPQLFLSGDGSLTGGLVSGEDVLQSAQSLKEKSPAVVVGPDSNPTLSFTSGSEGRPKGVLGRHFSLTHYFPWMAIRFGLSENDRFTMLSGIAHDPIQRDIFTPLFLGAQIMVPSQEDIQHEKLAEWMREHETTVTHLTPAMGQILVGGASAEFPSLRNAFFVGDVLIKRDVRRLQALAPNVTTVNMFGTTETQRAVSYYAVPSRNKDPDFLDKLPDAIPAGRGMDRVQLLVVDRENQNRVCDVGEIGEIYVRAAGLSEGYLGQDDLNRQKFVPNWFVDPQKWIEQDKELQKQSTSPEPWREFYKGPRDRLYRSGDLGRYIPSGDVECTGRADNQVKIRGFRIELGELDSHLSSHPLIRENVTLVRRDKDEEQTLVSYIVPEMSRWSQWLQEKGLPDDSEDTSMVGMLKRFQALRDDAREFLKTKVPAYAVPPIIVPLSRMPLNPNGKVDKPALPFPTPTELNAAAPQRASFDSSAFSPTEKAIAEIWGGLLENVPANTIGPEDSFFDLGGHSLTAQRMLLQVRKKWQGIDILMQAIYDFPTLRDFSSEVDAALDPEGRRLDLDRPDLRGKLNGVQVKQELNYSIDATDLALSLPSVFKAPNIDTSKTLTFFVTGATGFLGAFILQNLLSRSQPIKIFAHVRAKDAETALGRVRQTCKAYCLWKDSWSSKLECVVGDLEKPQLGVSDQSWKKLSEEVDIIIHNGARVHWVTRYPSLRASNVLSTIALIALAAQGKPKHMSFVSSTAVLDNDYYADLSYRIVSEGGSGIPESDNLEGSSKGLDTGYAQTKWTSEFLMRESGKRGLVGAIIRPGYVMGDSTSGACITDDFMVRLLKGCVELGCRPSILNTMNMVPVDEVAAVVVAASLHPPVSPLGVVNVSPSWRLTLSSYLSCLEECGYQVPEVDYESWRQSMVEYVERKGDHALLPLFHLVTTNLDESTRARELDTTNALTALQADASFNSAKTTSGTGSVVTPQLVARYVAYLVELGFMPSPEIKNALPKVKISDAQWQALKTLQGRGAVG